MAARSSRKVPSRRCSPIRSTRIRAPCCRRCRRTIPKRPGGRLPPNRFGRDEMLTIVLGWNTRLGRRTCTPMSDTIIDDAIAGGRAMPSAPPPPYRRQTYRPDIDGLRAIAVLAVVAFHFNVGPVPGGFTGVDIFFVISGYLITGNILDNLRAGSFTFSDFYQRRIRRIFPALLVVLLF